MIKPYFFNRSTLSFLRRFYGYDAQVLPSGCFEEVASSKNISLNNLLQDCARWLEVNCVLEVPLEFNIVEISKVRPNDAGFIVCVNSNKVAVFGVCPSKLKEAGNAERFYLTSLTAMLNFLKVKINE